MISLLDKIELLNEKVLDVLGDDPNYAEWAIEHIEFNSFEMYIERMYLDANMLWYKQVRDGLN